MYYNKFFEKNGAEAYFTSLEEMSSSIDSLDGLAIVMPNQTHTANVAEANGTCDTFPDTDALITTCRDFAVGVRTADCVPIVLYAPDIKAVAAVHAGWRGTINGIVDNAVCRLIEAHADPAKMYAAFAPAVCADCYEIDSRLATEFADAGFADCLTWHQNDDKAQLDLIAVNTKRLIALGLKPENISVSGLCTKHSLSPFGKQLFPSWRLTPGEPRRMITFIRLT